MKGTLSLEKRPKAILFDWDNTLIDSWPVIHDALNATLKAFAVQTWTLDETKQRVRKSLRDSFPGLFGERWQEAGTFFYDHFQNIHLQKLQPLPGAENLLKILNDLNIYLGVISNKKGCLLRRESKHLGWDDYFKTLVGANDAQKDKPATDPVDLALVGSGIPRGRDVWFVGDADIDIECAINAGCTPILIRKSPPIAKEFNVHKPQKHFVGCIDFMNYILKL